MPLPHIDPRRWPLLGAVIAVCVCVLDYILFRVLEVDMRWQGHDVTWAVISFYLVNFAGAGWLLGRVFAQRRQIRAQLSALAEAGQREAQLAKLAAVGRLAAGVAHEVRNPLAVIKSSTALLAEDAGASDDTRMAAGFIDAEIDRLDGFIGSLLDYARPFTLEPMRMPIAAVIDQIEPLAQADATRRGVEFEAVDRSEGALGNIDPTPLGQAILSLLVNASEVAHRVTLRAGPGPIIEVVDDGPGVPEADAVSIFEPFFTTKAQGTGLGLAMAARIVEAHGAVIEVVQGAGLGPGGRGACFRVQLSAA